MSLLGSLFGRKLTTTAVDEMVRRGDVAGLIKASKDDDVDVRRQALTKLGFQPDRRAFRAIFEAAATEADAETKEYANLAFWVYHNRVHGDNLVTLFQLVAAEPQQDMKLALMHAYLEKLIRVEIVERDIKPSESEVISALLLYMIENKDNLLIYVIRK